MITPSGDGIALREVTPADRAFLEDVYASAREAELAPVPWSPGEKRTFLDSQFALQDEAYRRRFPPEAFLVIEEQGAPIGRVVLAELDAGELRIADIALLPAHRGRGIGSSLIRDVIAEGEHRGVPVSLHVERWNPAWRLYERLGFVEVSEAGAYVLLRRLPARVAPPS